MFSIVLANCTSSSYIREVPHVSWPKMGASSPRKIRTPSKKRLLGRNGSFFGHKVHPTVARKGNFDLDEYLIYYLRAVKFLGQIYSPFNAKIAPINVWKQACSIHKWIVPDRYSSNCDAIPWNIIILFDVSGQLLTLVWSNNLLMGMKRLISRTTRYYDIDITSMGL